MNFSYKYFVGHASNDTIQQMYFSSYTCYIKAEKDVCIYDRMQIYIDDGDAMSCRMLDARYMSAPFCHLDFVDSAKKYKNIKKIEIHKKKLNIVSNSFL